MKEYFKDQNLENASPEDIKKYEIEKESLREIITQATTERTKEILYHFQEIAENIRLEIDEIDRLLGVLKTEKDIPQYDINTVEHELILNMNNLKDQLGEYNEQHPLFHNDLQAYKKITQEVQSYIDKLKNKESISDEEGKHWEIRRDVLINELVRLEKSITNNLTDVDISKIPPSLN